MSSVIRFKPSFHKCVEAVLKGDELEVKGARVAVGNLMNGLNRFTNPVGEFGQSDDVLKSIESASKPQDTDFNVKIVAEMMMPLMKGFCVFNVSHHKALEAKQPDNYGMVHPPSLKWKGLGLGNPRLWYGELDMLLCPNLNSSISDSGKRPDTGIFFKYKQNNKITN